MRDAVLRVLIGGKRTPLPPLGTVKRIVRCVCVVTKISNTASPKINSPLHLAAHCKDHRHLAHPFCEFIAPSRFPKNYLRVVAVCLQKRLHNFKDNALTSRTVHQESTITGFSLTWVKQQTRMGYCNDTRERANSFGKYVATCDVIPVLCTNLRDVACD